MNEPTGDPFAYDRFLEQTESRMKQRSREHWETLAEYETRGYRRGLVVGFLIAWVSIVLVSAAIWFLATT